MSDSNSRDTTGQATSPDPPTPARTSRLYTEIRGSGPELVLLHGWGLNMRIWDGLWPRYVDRFRIITVDLPGHGRSGWQPEARRSGSRQRRCTPPAPRCGREYFLFGWTLGGQIALDLAAAPEPAERASAWCS